MRAQQIFAAFLLTLPMLASACDIRMSQHELDYGNLHVPQLISDGNGGYEMGARSISVNIECEQPRTFELQMDAIPSTDGRTFLFGPLGEADLRLLDARVDDAPVVLTEQGGSPASQLTFRPGMPITAMRGADKAEGRRFSVQMRVNPRLLKTPATVRDHEDMVLHGQLRLLDQ